MNATRFVLAAIALYAVLATASAQDCVADPTDVDCTDYMYPMNETMADVEMLCNMHGGMSTCSIRMLCTGMSGGSGAHEHRVRYIRHDGHEHDSDDHGDLPDVADEFCMPFVFLSSICAGDPTMSMMPPCADYNSLCGDGSVVEQCADMGPIPDLPGTLDTAQNIKDICTADASAAPCDRCDAQYENCDDPLMTLAMLCQDEITGAASECSNMVAFCMTHEETVHGVCHMLASGASATAPTVTLVAAAAVAAAAVVALAN